MKLSFRLTALLTISWLFSAVAGAVIALSIRPAFLPTTLRLNQLEIVDAKGAPRITLGLQAGSPFLRFVSAAQIPLIELKTDAIPAIQINDQDGGRTISLAAIAPQHGLIAFDSSNRVGKLLLGRSGITDDGTDTAVWGMQVSGRSAEEFSTGHILGMLTVDGKDKGFFWPGDPNPSKSKAIHLFLASRPCHALPSAANPYHSPCSCPLPSNIESAP